jgi:LuxR family maltose regulon positive regulatory protein
MEIWFEMQRSPEDRQVRARAKSWAKEQTPDPSFPFALGIGPYHRDAEYFCNLTWAHIQIALGNFQDADIFIEPALQTAKECGLIFRVAELSIVRALIFDGLGDSAGAIHELKTALEIAEDHGYTRFFDDGPELDRLLQQAAERNIHASYAKQLLISMRMRSKITRPQPNLGKDCLHLVDSLSERELEVLGLLATGLSPTEVAKKLFLSPFTLKAHTQNIYTKLGVHSRVEAINKAREMDLI